MSWDRCRFLTCSALPVRVACDLTCAFCFSRSSISALEHPSRGWSDDELGRYFTWARARGATRLVVTGGGEPLLRPDRALQCLRVGRDFFAERALFTNGTRLDRALARALSDEGLSYLCWSRHHDDDARNRALMGEGAPDADAVLAAAEGLAVRATCVMARGWVETRDDALRYVGVFRARGVREFTFKHTYVAHARSLFRESPQDAWARAHRVALDPFAGDGEVVGALPWGPTIRSFEGARVCFYWEPNPEWELANGLCRSSNLLSDGTVWASLEDARSRLSPWGSSTDSSETSSRTARSSLSVMPRG